MARHTVCKASDLKTGEMIPATVGRVRVLVSRLPNGEVRAFTGRCPHQGAKLEFGCITHLNGGARVNEITVDKACSILRCPWHGFEFSLESGQALVENDNGKFLRLRKFDVETDGEDIVVVT